MPTKEELESQVQALEKKVADLEGTRDLLQKSVAELKKGGTVADLGDSVPFDDWLAANAANLIMERARVQTGMVNCVAVIERSGPETSRVVLTEMQVSAKPKAKKKKALEDKE